MYTAKLQLQAASGVQVSLALVEMACMHVLSSQRQRLLWQAHHSFVARGVLLHLTKIDDY